MKKATVGRSESKKQTTTTLAHGHVGESKLSVPTKPEKMDQRKRHGYTLGEVKVPPKTISVHESKLRSQRLLKAKNQLLSLINVEKAYALEGDSEGLILLFGAATFAIEGIMGTQIKHPSMVSAFAKTVEVWPVFVTTDKKANKMFQKAVSQLELGAELQTTDCGFIPGPRPAHAIAAALFKMILFLRKSQITHCRMREIERQVDKEDKSDVELAMSEFRSVYDAEHGGMLLAHAFLFQTLGIKPGDSSKSVVDQVRIDSVTLPELSKETWLIWFEFAWKLLLTITDEHPERNEVLKKIGASGKSKHEKAPVATEEANVRDEIRKAIKRSFKVCCNLKK